MLSIPKAWHQGSKVRERMVFRINVKTQSTSFTIKEQMIEKKNTYRLMASPSVQYLAKDGVVKQYENI